MRLQFSKANSLIVKKQMEMLRHELYCQEGKNWNSKSNTQKPDPNSFARHSRHSSCDSADFSGHTRVCQWHHYIFSHPLTKWYTVSKIINKLSKTNGFALFGRQLCKNLEGTWFTGNNVRPSVRFVLQASLTCHCGMALLLPRSTGLSYVWVPLLIQWLIPLVPKQCLSVSLYRQSLATG